MEKVIESVVMYRIGDVDISMFLQQQLHDFNVSFPTSNVESSPTTLYMDD